MMITVLVPKCYYYCYFKSGKNKASIKGLPMRNIIEVLPNSFFSLNSLLHRLFDVNQIVFPTCSLNVATRVREVGGPLCFDGE